MNLTEARNATTEKIIGLINTSGIEAVELILDLVTLYDVADDIVYQSGLDHKSYWDGFVE